MAGGVVVAVVPIVALVYGHTPGLGCGSSVPRSLGLRRLPSQLWISRSAAVSRGKSIVAWPTRRLFA